MIKRAKPLRLTKPLVFDDLADVPYLFCLPEAGRRMLLSVTERLTWDATWIDESGQRVGLTPDELDIVEQTIDVLCGGVSVESIVEALNGIQTAIENQNLTCNCGGADMSNCGCCCGSAHQQENQQTIQELYNELSAADLAWLEEILCFVDEQPEDNYKCQAINYIVDEWLGMNTELKEANDLGGITAAIVEAIILAKNWTIKGISVILAVIEYILNLITDSVFLNYSSMLIANRQGLVNAMYNASSPVQSRANVMEWVGNLTNVNPVVKTYFRAMAYTLTNYDIIYIDDGSVPDDYPITTPCSFEVQPPPSGYTLLPWPIESATTETYTTITIDPIDSHKATITIDNTAEPSSGMIAGWQLEDIGDGDERAGYAILITTNSLSGDVNEVRWYDGAPYINSVQFDTYDAGQVSLLGRASGEAGLQTWIEQTLPAFQDQAMLPAAGDRSSGFLVINNASSVVTGTISVEIYRVRKDA